MPPLAVWALAAVLSGTVAGVPPPVGTLSGGPPVEMQLGEKVRLDLKVYDAGGMPLVFPKKLTLWYIEGDARWNRLGEITSGPEPWSVWFIPAKKGTFTVTGGFAIDAVPYHTSILVTVF